MSFVFPFPNVLSPLEAECPQYLCTDSSESSAQFILCFHLCYLSNIKFDQGSLLFTNFCFFSRFYLSKSCHSGSLLGYLMFSSHSIYSVPRPFFLFFSLPGIAFSSSLPYHIRMTKLNVSAFEKHSWALSHPIESISYSCLSVRALSILYYIYVYV